MGQRITHSDDLREALTTHAIKVCNKAREQHSLIKKIYIFASSSPYDERYIKKSIMYDFTIATDHIFSVAAAIDQVLHVLYVDNVHYYRCGVGAIELESKDFQQHDLFIRNDNPALMNCYSKINQRFGKGTLQLASEAKHEKWSMRREFLSPRYTTRWSDIPKILC